MESHLKITKVYGCFSNLKNRFHENEKPGEKIDL
jgi:hypothetical protein